MPNGFDLDTSFFQAPTATPTMTPFSLPDLNVGRFAGPGPGIADWASSSGLTDFAAPFAPTFTAMSPGSLAGTSPYGPAGPRAPDLPPDTGWGLGDVSSLAKQVAPILSVGTSLAQIPLSLAALSQAGRGTKALEGAVGTEARAAAPGIAASEKLLPAGTNALLTGTLPPELQAAVDQQVSQAEQSLLQHLVSQGIDPATARAMIETQMQELRTQLTLQYAQALLSGGGATGGQAVEAAALGGRLAGAETAMAGSSLSAAQQALARLTAGG